MRSRLLDRGELAICTGYRVDGDLHTEFPADASCWSSRSPCRVVRRMSQPNRSWALEAAARSRPISIAWSVCGTPIVFVSGAPPATIHRVPPASDDTAYAERVPRSGGRASIVGAGPAGRCGDRGRKPACAGVRPRPIVNGSRLPGDMTFFSTADRISIGTCVHRATGREQARRAATIAAGRTTLAARTRLWNVGVPRRAPEARWRATSGCRGGPGAARRRRRHRYFGRPTGAPRRVAAAVQLLRRRALRLYHRVGDRGAKSSWCGARHYRAGGDVTMSISAALDAN